MCVTLSNIDKVNLPLEKAEAKKRQIRKPDSVTQLIVEQKGEAIAKAGKQLNVNRTYVGMAKETQGKRTDLLSNIDKKLPAHNTQKELAIG